MSNAYKQFLSFILRLSPTEIAGNLHLIQRLLRRKGMNDSSSNDPLTVAISTSGLPIIFVNQNLSVEYANLAFSHVFGFDRSHIIGYPITIFMIDSHLLEYLQLPNSGQSKTFFEISCQKENGTIVHVKSTVLKMDEGFALILEDLTSSQSLLRQLNQYQAKNQRLEAYVSNPLGIGQGGIFEDCALLLFKLRESTSAEHRQNVYQQIDEICSSYKKIVRTLLPDGTFLIFSIVGNHQQDPEHKDSESHSTQASSQKQVAKSSQAIFGSFPPDIIPEIIDTGTSQIENIFDIAFRIVSLFESTSIHGNFNIGISIGGPLFVRALESQTKKILIGGDVYNEALSLLKRGSSAKINLSSKAYERMGMNQYISFTRDENKQCWIAELKDSVAF